MDTYKIKTWIPEEWTAKEWQKFKEKLENLSLSELGQLANAVGIKFTAPTKTLNQEDYINVMDEANKKKLLEEYQKIIVRR